MIQTSSANPLASRDPAPGNNGPNSTSTQVSAHTRLKFQLMCISRMCFRVKQRRVLRKRQQLSLQRLCQHRYQGETSFIPSTSWWASVSFAPQEVLNHCVPLLHYLTLQTPLQVTGRTPGLQLLFCTHKQQPQQWRKTAQKIQKMLQYLQARDS